MLFLAVSVSAALLLSCAKVPTEEMPELYWPSPPEKPRVKFINLIIGSIDVTGVRSSKIKHLLFGVESEVKFFKPSFVTAAKGVMFVSDVNIVHVFDFNNNRYSTLGKGHLGNATGIAISEDGKVVVGDSTRKRVFIFDLKGGPTAMLGADGFFKSIGGVAVDDLNNRIIISDSKGHKVSSYTFDGKLVFSIDKRGVGPGEFNFPYDVEVGKDGRIYVVDAGNFRIQIFDSSGKFLTAFGSIGLTPGSFSRPKGIALDTEGHIYVVDAAFANFQIMDDQGRVYLAVGSGGSAPGQFQLPSDIHVDEEDTIYVVDQLNKRIQMFQYMTAEQ